MSLPPIVLFLLALLAVMFGLSYAAAVAEREQAEPCNPQSNMKRNITALAEHDFQLYAAGAVGPTNTSSNWNYSISALYPNGSFPSDADIQRYQIALWISILLVVVALSAVYALAFMEFKKDTILYSSFNPNWEERKRR